VKSGEITIVFDITKMFYMVVENQL